MLLYNPQKSDFLPDECFLCGIPLTDAIRTREHIFPKWLISQFSLGTKKFALAFDRKKVGYKQITIPCCKNCNSAVLAPLEARIRKNFIDNRDHEYDLAKQEIALWAGKVYYGILLYDYHDAILNLKNEVEILAIKDLLLTPNAIQLHIFLQSLIKPIHINCLQLDFPVSFIEYKLKLLPHVGEQFDFRTSPFSDSFLIRIGKRGFVIAFDGGYLDIHKYAFSFERYSHNLLHPIQFNELAARFMHLSSMKTRNRSYLILSNSDGITIDYNFENTRHPYKNLTYNDLLYFLQATSQWGIDRWVNSNGELLSYLEDENGFIDQQIHRD